MDTIQRWQKEYGQGQVYKTYTKDRDGVKRFKNFQTRLKLIDGSIQQITRKKHEDLVVAIASAIKKIDRGEILVPRPKATLPQSISNLIKQYEMARINNRMSQGNFNYKHGLAKKVIKIVCLDDHMACKNIRDWEGSDSAKLVDMFRKQTKSSNVLGAYLKVVQDAFYNSTNTNDYDAKLENPIVQYKQNPINKLLLKVDTETHKAETMNLVEKWHFDHVKEFRNSIDDVTAKLIVRICFQLGLRIGEVLGAEINDFIDSTGNVMPKLDIRGQISQKDIYKRDVKTPAGKRLIPVGKGLADDLRSYIEHRKNDIYGNNNIMFPFIKDGRATWHVYRTCNKIIEPYLTGKFALPKSHKFHFFRHWCITYWKRHNIYSSYDISRYVGHKDETVTARLYTHYFCKALEEEDRCNRQDYIDGLLF